MCVEIATGIEAYGLCLYHSADGPLYAFELRHTLANATVLPWLVYGSACEAAAEGLVHHRN